MNKDSRIEELETRVKLLQDDLIMIAGTMEAMVRKRALINLEIVDLQEKIDALVITRDLVKSEQT